MPEGHTLHRLARQFRRELGGRDVRAASPQGRFATGAAQLDGSRLLRTDAHGKQLFLGFGPPDAARADRWLRVHLGLIGTFTFGDAVDGVPPEPRGAVRLRLIGGNRFADLRGPMTCEVVTTRQIREVQAGLGPDPLRRDADPARFVARVSTSPTAVGLLLMDQTVVSGIGNVYRAEALFRAGLSPSTPGRDLPDGAAERLWMDLSLLLRDGVRRGAIVTVDARERPRGAVRRGDAHYVYRRTGLPCRRCGTPVACREAAGRNLYWCPGCQA
jgi:formamidopyrimidine-DNA glycosylase